MSTDLFLNPQVNQYGGSHMIMTNVHREPKHTIINIDTKFCDEYSNNRLNSKECSFNQSEFNFTIPDKLTNIKNMTIKSIELPMTYHNISNTIGNNFLNIETFNNDGSVNMINTPVIIPDGFYDYATISTAINSAMRTAGITNLILTTTSSLVSQFFNSSSYVYYQISFYLDKTGDFTKYNFKSKLGWLLGFRNVQYIIHTTIGSTSEGCLNLNQKYMYLAIDDFSNHNPVSFLSGMPKYFINKNIIAKILLDRSIYPNGSILCASEWNGLLISDTRVFSGDKHNIQKLNIKLLDENGNLVNLNGNDFSFTLYLE